MLRSQFYEYNFLRSDYVSNFTYKTTHVATTDVILFRLKKKKGFLSGD